MLCIILDLCTNKVVAINYGVLSKARIAISYLMPTISSSVVPPPKSWDEFEDITLAASKLRWGSDAFFRNGRQGQKQDGVDVWGDDDGRQIGVQCKNSVDGISMTIIEAEIANAEHFKPRIDRLYIATTAKRDAPLQSSVRTLSADRFKRGEFRVEILFWEDICQEIAKDDTVFFAHYPQFRNKTDPILEHDRKLFDELNAILKPEGVIYFLDQNNMAGFSFKADALHPLFDFYNTWNKPHKEFIVPELETIRKALWSKAKEYVAIVSVETFPCNNPDYHTVPPEWETDQPERFWRVVDALHRLAGEIVDLHSDLVRTGRSVFIGTAK